MHMHSHVQSHVCSFFRVPEDCSAVVAALYESCLQDDPRLRPPASEIVSVLEKEVRFGAGRANSGPAPTLVPLANESLQSGVPPDLSLQSGQPPEGEAAEGF
jgi:hypothetical protein